MSALRQPSLASLRLFILVAKTFSFSETARLANVSQPALSRTIRLLEEDMGVRLFDRDTRNVRLTPAGEALLPIVERLTLDFNEAFAELAHTFAGRRGRVVFGALPSFAAGALPNLLRRFEAEYPQVEIVLRDNLSDSLYQQMQDREIDLAVAPPPKSDERAFQFDPLFEDACALVCRADDALDRPGAIPWTALNDRSFVAMAPGSSVRMMTDLAFARAGVGIKPRYECAQVASVAGLVSAGLGVSALPMSTQSMLHGLDLRWIPLEHPVIQRQIGLAKLANRSLAPAAQAFYDFLVEQPAHLYQTGNSR